MTEIKNPLGVLADKAEEQKDIALAKIKGSTPNSRRSRKKEQRTLWEKITSKIIPESVPALKDLYVQTESHKVLSTRDKNRLTMKPIILKFQNWGTKKRC